MNKLILSFYDEEVIVDLPLNIQQFNEVVSRSYSVDPQDVEELIIYFEDNQGRHNIRSPSEYEKLRSHFIRSKHEKSPSSVKVFLEVSEQSKLYLKELENSKVLSESVSILKSDDSVVSSQKEQLVQEIRDKERRLRELMEQEQLERQRLEKERVERIKEEEERLERERIELARKEEDEERARQEAERLEAERLEEERLELERLQIAKEKEALHESIRSTCSNLINQNIEKIKEELISKTVAETISSLNDTNNKESQSENKLPINRQPTIHRRYSCNSCNVFPIVGTRYRCVQCFDYDLCEKCEDEFGDSHMHPLVKHRIEEPFRGRHCPFRRNRCHKGGFLTKLAENFKTFLGDLSQCPDTQKVSEYKDSAKVSEVKEKYFLGNLSDQEAIDALKLCNDDVDKAVEHLCIKFLDKN